MRSTSLPQLRFRPPSSEEASTGLPKRFSAPALPRHEAPPVDAPPLPVSLEDQIAAILGRTDAESEQTRGFTQTAAFLTLVDRVDDASGIRTLLFRIPPELLYGFVQLLHALTLKAALLTPHSLIELVPRALEASANTPQANTVWLAFVKVLSDPGIPLIAAHTLLGCLSEAEPDMPPSKHIAGLYATAKQAITDAMARRAPALRDALDRVATPEALLQLLPELTPEMLRFAPTLLLKLTDQVCKTGLPLPPDLLIQAASQCLHASIGTQQEARVWLALCQQVQAPSLPLRAAALLFTCLTEARTAHRPPEEVVRAYDEAHAYLKHRRVSAEAEQRHMEERQDLPTSALPRPRSQSLPNPLPPGTGTQ